ncbi:MAG: hypothetical protein ABIT20_15855 [Gemmatimonadaceae bacterium]
MIDEHVFLLSPARCDGPRAKMLMSPVASFDLAQRLRSTGGAPIGEVFAFLSSLYFRGKLAYAQALTSLHEQGARIKVITSNRGLRAPMDAVTHADLVSFSGIDLADGDERYLGPLRRDAERVARTLPATGGVVLLGSIATGKYVDTLLSIFGDRLLFPADFVGRGDMSRGGLLLRNARAGTSLGYLPVAGAVRRGRRPPKLDRLSR